MNTTQNKSNGDRAQAEKDRLAKVEADRQAKEEREKANEERRKAEETGDYTIDDDTLSIIRSMIEKGCDRSTIKGMLKTLAKLRKNQVENAINDLMPERAKSSKAGIEDQFNQYCAEKLRTQDECRLFILTLSENYIKHMTYLLRRNEFFASIHTKYQGQ